jgi:hypothetical protein
LQFGNYGETLSQSGAGIPGGTPDFLVPGAYVFNNGAGGANVGSFNANFNFLGNVDWTNKNAITTVNRSQGVTVTWSGGDPNGTVQIYGYSVSDASENAVAGFFNCIERNSAGRFTVPASVLLALPATPSGGISLGAPLAGLSIGGVSNPVSFTAPGLDVGTIFSTNVLLKSVNFQ